MTEEELLIIEEDISGLRVVKKTTIPKWMNPKGFENMTIDSKVYDANYYRSSNYADYLERADRYRKTAKELSDLCVSLGLLNPGWNEFILDYGCAVGFLMEGLKACGHQRVYGMEVSDWAIEEAWSRGNDVFDAKKEIIVPEYQLMIALDVFEHMTDEQIRDLFNKARIKPKSLIVRIPSSTDGGKTFHLEVSRADPTHINCKTKEQWIEFFREFGYQTFLRLNLYTIYDTPGVTSLLIL
jgi:cyclopropane fatty-acyl-phospholipid synthase-like methyltransferase